MMPVLLALDQRVLEALYAARDPMLVQFFIWISELGRTGTVLGLAACLILLFLLWSKYRYAAGLAFSIGTSGTILFFLKGAVARMRPDVAYQAYIESWFSFPSAHATLAAAFYGFLLLLAGRELRNPFTRYAAVAGCAFIIVAIAFSRIYLGVHYLSDIILGLILGSVCAYIGMRFSRLVSI